LRRKAVIVLALGVGLVIGCVISWAWIVPAPVPRLERLSISVSPVSGTAPDGLSGFARHPDGRFFAIAERLSALIPMTLSKANTLTAESPVPITGAEGGGDFEGLAFLDQRRFAIATERHNDTDHNDVLVGELDGVRARIVERIPIRYPAWPMIVIGNRGLEGICAASGRLLVAVETVIEEGERRFAPLAVVEPTTRAMLPRRLRLTTETGRVSALECRERDGRIEAFAIERLYGVSRVLRFVLGPDETADVTPEPLIDLGAEDRFANFEGLALGSSDTLVALTDNTPPGLGPATVLFASAPAIASGGRALEVDTRAP
jgi:hypothetical protein